MRSQIAALGVLVIIIAALDWYIGGWQAFWKAWVLRRFDRTKVLAKAYNSARRPKSIRGPFALALAGLAMIGYAIFGNVQS